MSFTSSTSYNEALRASPVYQLDDTFDKLSVEEFVGEGVEDEMLFVTPRGSIVTEDFCGSYEEAQTISEDTPDLIFQSNSQDAVNDQPICELPPEQVRWFYKSDSDKLWIPFRGYDSLRIEERYRQLRTRPHAEVSRKPARPRSESTDSASTSSLDDSVFYDASSTGYTDVDYERATPPQDHVVVRAGMYEVDVEKRRCASIFWPGEQCAIVRGIWFYSDSWQPVDGDHNEEIENEHLSKFANQSVSDFFYGRDSKLPKSVINTMPFSEYHIDWFSPIEVYLFSEAAPSKFVRSFTQKLGYFQKTVGYLLKRGYRVCASLEDRPLDVTHLVFVIHGIGQKMDKDRIIRNTCTFRDCTSWVQSKYFPSSKNRAEFFPVEWRSSLKLDGGIVEAITPNKVQGIRQRLNATAMDIMFYTSPLYSGEIQQGLTCELNRLYSTFTQRNPDFTARGGKVSVIAHSLGCIIVYDIITGWSITHTLEQRKAQESCNNALNGVDVGDTGDGGSGGSNSPGSSQGTTPTPTPTHRSTKLLFELDNLFCMGSPLAVFLALRVRNPQQQSCHKDLLPPSLCHRFFNVFHPSDPVAYRLEPLLVREYTRVAPVQIQAYNAASHVKYSDIPLELIVQDGMTSSSQSAASRPAGEEGDSPKSPGGTPNRERGWSLWSMVRGSRRAPDDSGTPHLNSPTQGLEHRLDYVLRDGNLGGPYIAAITSHTDYWRNYDVAYFVLTRLFTDLEQETIKQSTATGVQSDSNQQTPPQHSPQRATSRVASPPLLQQMLTQVQTQAQSVLQIPAPSLPLPSPTLLQRKGSNEAASR